MLSFLFVSPCHEGLVFLLGDIGRSVRNIGLSFRLSCDDGHHHVPVALVICSIDGMRVDSQPQGNMLICINEDKPLVIGSVCMALGEAGVNIANLTLGRSGKGEKALTVLNLDASLSDETLEGIRNLPHVLQAAKVTLPEVN